MPLKTLKSIWQGWVAATAYKHSEREVIPDGYQYTAVSSFNGLRCLQWLLYHIQSDAQQFDSDLVHWTHFCASSLSASPLQRSSARVASSCRK